jgi:hypothetical protein
MGAYNLVLDVTASCPRCGTPSTIDVQFKYGATGQHSYRIGDRLTWGGNDIGTPGKGSVVVDGAADSGCSACGYDGDWDRYVHVSSDRIDRVTPADGSIDFVTASSSYVDT